jgi:hypothetical protein
MEIMAMMMIVMEKVKLMIMIMIDGGIEKKYCKAGR